jgi:hypothetical protein
LPASSAWVSLTFCRAVPPSTVQVWHQISDDPSASGRTLTSLAWRFRTARPTRTPVETKSHERARAAKGSAAGRQ